MKRENINLVIILIIIIVPLVMLFSTTHKINETLSSGTKDMSEYVQNADDEIENFRALFLIPLIGLGTFASVALFLLSGAVIFVTFVSALLAILARAIINNKKNKVAYRVLMTIVFIPYTILAYIFLTNGIAHGSLISCVYGAVGLVGIIIAVINTYSRKMFIEENAIQEETEIQEVVEKDNKE